MNILLVGASSSLGEAIRLRALKTGHQVVGTYSNNKKSDDDICVDVRDEESIVSGLAEAKKRLRSIDAMIYCSAIDCPELVVQANIDNWQEVFDVNFFGALRLSKHLVQDFVRQDGGILQFISSGLATRSNVGTSAYASSKAALNALAKGISKEYAKSGVRSYTVMPGFFDGGLIRNLSNRQKNTVEALLDTKKIASCEEIAGFCVSLLDCSSYLTATNLEIHGGLA